MLSTSYSLFLSLVLSQPLKKGRFYQCLGWKWSKREGGLVFGIDKQYPKPFFLSLVRTQVLKTETLLVYLKGTPKEV